MRYFWADVMKAAMGERAFWATVKHNIDREERIERIRRKHRELRSMWEARFEVERLAAAGIIDVPEQARFRSLGADVKCERHADSSGALVWSFAATGSCWTYFRALR